MLSSLLDPVSKVAHVSRVSLPFIGQPFPHVLVDLYLMHELEKHHYRASCVGLHTSPDRRKSEVQPSVYLGALLRQDHSTELRPWFRVDCTAQKGRPQARQTSGLTHAFRPRTAGN